MTAWLPTLALLACPIGMGLMMFVMMCGKQNQADPREQEVSRLRAEVDQLRAELRDGRPAEEPRP